MMYLFYSVTFLFFIYGLEVFRNADKYQRFVKRLRDKAKFGQGFSAKDVFYVFISLFFQFWVWCGLFSTQWQIFLFVLLVSFIPMKRAWVRKTLAAVYMVAAVLIVVSKFHHQIYLI